MADLGSVSGSSVPSFEMLGEKVLATWRRLSSTVGILFHLENNHVCFTIFLWVVENDRLFLVLPLLGLYSADYKILS